MPIAFPPPRQVPADTDVLGIPVAKGGRISGPGADGRTSDFLAERGFEGRLGETLAVPRDDGVTVVAVRIRDARDVDATALRPAAAAFARAPLREARGATT